MTKVPSLNYNQVIRALRRDGWVVVRQKGSHIRLQKALPNKTLKIIIPAHSPIKRSTGISLWSGDVGRHREAGTQNTKAP